MSLVLQYTVFEYNSEFQNVICVTHNNFNSCNVTVNRGNDSFHVSINGHCQADQRIDIRVSTTPSPSPPPLSPSSGIIRRFLAKWVTSGSSQSPVLRLRPLLVALFVSFCTRYVRPLGIVVQWSVAMVVYIFGLAV
ncbi:uncharacterized protein LOC130791870 [Actinidia eriantha]|uniref:uncharacterized protein LOC130791870 n=1 Tax=Actinidia eriantha TaxID=165200 RepID=UPI0025906167|nr:uncharacterized protein LOC130791870 [Actinidia eriantha]